MAMLSIAEAVKSTSPGRQLGNVGGSRVSPWWSRQGSQSPGTMMGEVIPLILSSTTGPTQRRGCMVWPLPPLRNYRLLLIGPTWPGRWAVPRGRPADARAHLVTGFPFILARSLWRARRRDAPPSRRVNQNRGSQARPGTPRLLPRTAALFQ